MALASGKNSTEKSRYSIKTILLEISKCEILCANCHREHTFPESNVISNDDLKSYEQNQI